MVRNNTTQDIEAGYEAQRQANIKANLELMMSLGLYQSSTFLYPKPPSTPKAKSSPKAKAASSSGFVDGGEDVEQRVERPKRITRSVSRVMEPKQSTARGMKRALSDEGLPSRKTKRSDLTEYNPDAFIDSDNSDDDKDETYRSRKSSRPHTSFNPNRNYRDKAELQRHSDRLGIRIHNPKTFGSIPGIPIGTLFSKRIHASTAAIHAPTVAGISGNEEVGCWSICLSGGYEDDIDSGHTFTYTGSGGRDLKGTANNPKNLRTAPQSSDQEWEGKNAALKKSVKTGKPVRVMRGWKGRNKWCPREGEGYVYCGLYKAVDAWMETGKAGFLVCRFRFVRLPGQEPLPTFDHEREESGDEAEAGDEREESEDEVQVVEPPKEVSAREMSARNRAQPRPSMATSSKVAASPSPTPSNRSIRSTSSISPHPILKSASSDFDRSQYTIISDSDSDVVEVEREEEEEVQLILEVDAKGKEVEERVARRSPRKSKASWKKLEFKTGWKTFRS